MAKGKLYTGIALEDGALKVAVVRVANKKINLVKLDKFSLISKVEKGASKAVAEASDEDIFGGMDADLSDDSVFDIDIDDSGLEDLNLDEELSEDNDDDLDLDLDDLEESDEDIIVDVDMVDETETPVSNELLLYNILSAVNSKKINLGLNIQAGVAIYQILKDVDFNDVKKKDLRIIIDDRLESLYGTSKGEDFFSYSIRDDGALLLSSIDEDPSLLQLVNRTIPMYRGKLFIEEILPDETILIGLVRANYELSDDGVTCLVQFKETNCRVIFLKGERLWLVSPIITEGTNSKKFLNTVFSKILFQLDTGEVPNLDRLIICNNSLGEESITFFQDRFPDLNVDEFTFSEDFFEPGEYTQETLSPFTTAIGTAWSATGHEKDYFSGITFVPNYVRDRQKIFKLQWHGFLILLLIMVSFPVLDYFRQKADSEIYSLENEISILDAQIQAFTPTVNNYNRISAELEQIQEKLQLMNTLAENSITWSVNLDLVNSGIDDVNSVWLTSVTVGSAPNTLSIQGIARYRNRIPLVAEIFADATLQNVSSTTIRDQEVYLFSYEVRRIVSNTSVYTPEDLQGLEGLTGN